MTNTEDFNEDSGLTIFDRPSAVVKCADLASVKALFMRISDICMDATTENTCLAYETAVCRIMDICDIEIHDITKLLRV